MEYGTTRKETLVLTLYVVGLARKHIIHWESCIQAICLNDHSLLQFVLGLHAVTVHYGGTARFVRAP